MSRSQKSAPGSAPRHSSVEAAHSRTHPRQVQVPPTRVANSLARFVVLGGQAADIAQAKFFAFAFERTTLRSTDKPSHVLGARMTAQARESDQAPSPCSDDGSQGDQVRAGQVHLLVQVIYFSSGRVLAMLSAVMLRALMMPEPLRPPFP